MNTKSGSRTGILKWTAINGLILHCALSGIWVVGFGAGMTAFNGGEGVELSKALLGIHSIFYYPLHIGQQLGLPAGVRGPFPSLGTIAWCFIVGFGLLKLRGLIGQKRSEQAVPPKSDRAGG